MSKKLLDGVGQFLLELRRTPLLTPEQEITLGRQVMAFLFVLEQQSLRRKSEQEPLSLEAIAEEAKTVAIGRQAKKKLIQSNLRLVFRIASKPQYQGKGLDLMVLIQEGSIGLDRAVEKFDPRKGYRFTTYAYWWIRQGITRALSEQSRTIRIPVHIIEKLAKAQKYSREQKIKGRSPSAAEIAQVAELHIDDLRYLSKIAQVPASLDQTVGDDDSNNTLIDFLPADREDSAPDLPVDVSKHLQFLTPREQHILDLTFGLNGDEPINSPEIGRRLNLSRERVRQLRNRALRKLKQRISKEYRPSELMGWPSHSASS